MNKNHSYIISGDVSDWLYDLLPLSNNHRLPGRILTFPVEELRNVLAFKHHVDFVYPLGSDAVLGVSMRDQSIAVYNYKTHAVEDRYDAKTSGAWIDVFCVPLAFREFYRFTLYNSDAASIYILTDHGQVIKLRVEWRDSVEYKIELDYLISIPTDYQITQILPCRTKEKCYYGKNVLDSFYLWLPSKRLIQKYSLFSNSDRSEPTPKLSIEIKLKYPIDYADSSLYSKQSEALTLCLDEVAKSVIVADACSHCIFEFSLTEKDSNVLYSFCEKVGQREENRSDMDRLCGPFFPLVLRPLEYVQYSMLSGYSQNATKADPTGVLPRMILVFSNEQLLKLWQFPESSAILDLSGQTIQSTLMEKGSDVPSTKQESVNACFDRLHSMSVGAAGQLAVVTEEEVYLLFSGVSSAESQIYAISGLSQDS